MNVDSAAFESFCAESALQQRGDGVSVPPAASQSFAYYQWLEVVRTKYEASLPSALAQATPATATRSSAPPTPKRTKTEGTAAEVSSSSSSVLTLAEVLAERLAKSLEAQAVPTQASAALRHAAQQPFPMPPAAADMPAFLALAEAAIRLTLWAPQDARLAQLAARLRPNLRTLEERGIIRLCHGCFPALQVLMDLLSWRIIAHRWARLSLEMRQVAVDGVLTLCDCLDSVATEVLRCAAQALPMTASPPSPTSPPAAVEVAADDMHTMDLLVAHASASVPFQFPTCRDLADLYPEPTGVLRVPGDELGASDDSAPPVHRPEQPTAMKRERTGDAGVRVDDLLAATPTMTPAAQASSTLPTPQAPARRVAAPGSAAQGRVACSSRFHARYADATKHASAACPFCATCHVMEVLFGGDTRRCCWGHWPTPRRLQLHLQRHPHVLRLAQARLSRLKQGERLSATDEVPL